MRVLAKPPPAKPSRRRQLSPCADGEPCATVPILSLSVGTPRACQEHPIIFLSISASTALAAENYSQWQSSPIQRGVNVVAPAWGHD